MLNFKKERTRYAVTACLLGAAMLSASCSGPGPVAEIAPREFVQTQTSTPAEIDALQAIKQAADEISAVRDMARIQSAVSMAVGLDYQPASGLQQDFADATVFATSDGSLVVSVPLRGTNTPEVTRVSYMHVNGNWSTMELSVHQDSDEQASLKMWLDGALVRDQVVTRPTALTDYGMNWGRLKRCLVDDAGLNWVILSSLATICSVACLVSAGTGCVLCVAGVAGFNTGTIGACVRRSWQ